MSAFKTKDRPNRIWVGVRGNALHLVQFLCISKAVLLAEKGGFSPFLELNVDPAKLPF